MKITFLLPYNAVGGGTRVVALYARKLTERGHEVHVVSQPFSAPGGVKHRLKRMLGRAPALVRPPRSTLLDFLGERHHVLTRPGPPHPENVPDADVIIATWWETAEWAAALPPGKGRKFYLLQGYEVFPHLPVERVIATYSLPLKKIAVSDYIRSEIETNHGATGISVVHNAVDLAQFQAPARARNRALTVGYLYSPGTMKRSWLAIDALKAAKAQVPDLRAVLFGARPVAAETPLPDWAEFEKSPAQSRIPEIYASCDLWLFTSDNEGFGLPILEAMACRTPVLATAAGAAPQLIDGTNGQIQSDDATAFAEAIAKFAQMPDAEWRNWSDAAYRTAQDHSWETASDRLLAILESKDQPQI